MPSCHGMILATLLCMTSSSPVSNNDMRCISRHEHESLLADRVALRLLREELSLRPSQSDGRRLAEVEQSANAATGAQPHTAVPVQKRPTWHRSAEYAQTGNCTVYPEGEGDIEDRLCQMKPESLMTASCVHSYAFDSATALHALSPVAAVVALVPYICTRN